MTRDDDTFMPLYERVRFARSRMARRCSFPSMPMQFRAAKGRRKAPPSIRCRNTPPTPKPPRLAEAENRADAIAGVDLSTEPDDVANILVDLAQRETKACSRCNLPARWSASSSPAAPLHVHPLKSGRLYRAQGAGRAFGAGGARLYDDQKRSYALDVAGMAFQDGAFAGGGGQYFFAPRLAGAAAARGAD